jgi:hypothetical protein
MAVIKIHDILHKRALITRGSAAAIREALLANAGTKQITLDFTGIDAVTPSFVDELLTLLEEALGGRTGEGTEIVFLHPPTRLSTKFSAIGRARNLDMAESEDHAWRISSRVRPLPN